MQPFLLVSYEDNTVLLTILRNDELPIILELEPKHAKDLGKGLQVASASALMTDIDDQTQPVVA